MSRLAVPAVATLTFLLGAPTLVHAHTVTWCAYIPVQYNDSDAGSPQYPEDHWEETTSSTFKAARGNFYVILELGGELEWSGYLYDGLNGTAGCTAGLTMGTGTYAFFVYSDGKVQGNWLYAYDEDGVGSKYVVASPVSVNASGTKNFYSSPAGETDEVFNVYQAAAWALYRHAGGMTGETYILEAGDPTGCSAGDSTSCSSSANNKSFIGTGQIRKKFLIAHELGHVLGYHATHELNGGMDYGYDGNSGTILDACDENTSSGNHGFLELEWVGAALGEGFCDFYAADVWNDHGEYDCWFGAWRTPSGLSCESGTTDYPNAWVNGHTCRNPDDPESGERIDWMRILWDVHTNAASGNPSFTDMLQDWLAAGDWNRETAFTEIDGIADSLNGTLDNNWAAAIDYNAAYYCPPDGDCRP